MCFLKDILAPNVLGSNRVDYRVMDLSLYRNEMEEYFEFLKKRTRDRAILDIEEEDCSKRVYPECSLEGAKALIVFFVPYFDSNLIFDGNNISIHAQAKDYHHVVKTVLSRAKDELGKHYPNEEFICQCDTGPLCERFFAIHSGLCLEGDNGMAIHETYGSYGFLGLIVTTAKFEATKSFRRYCISCGRCKKSCPGSVLGSDNRIYHTCISWLTQKKSLTPNDEANIKKAAMVYGCDECQKVCPYNWKLCNTDIDEFKTDFIGVLTSEELQAFSNRSFRKAYSNRTFAWRGKQVLERNIDIIKGKK
ncbi:epoxyqueuosine reductase [Filifactor villosus]|uniref:Epoxyqueuosine reductase n=1 Tax=Filifactor villosus TaxID=29374 RepID=A0ABV9QI90_9FIRM